MAEPHCFQTQLNSIMEIMSRAVVRQICKIVDSDLSSLRLELERALRDNAALGDKMRVLESEVGTLRKAGARGLRKSYRSVYIQTSEDAPPSINRIFGKEWCSSLWDGRSRTREEAVEVEPDICDEAENDEDGSVHDIKEEIPEQEICFISPKSANRRKTTSTSPDAPDHVADDDDDDDIHFICADFPEISDADNAVPDSPGASATKLISEDGTVQHVIVSGDDDDDNDEEEAQLEFEQHCMPIEFTDAAQGGAAVFQRQDAVSHHMSGSGGGGGCSEEGGGAGAAGIFNYFDRFNILQQPGPGDDPSKTDFTCSECGKTFLRRNGLTLHMKSHQKQNAHTCHACKVSFPQKNLLRTHKCLPPGKTPTKTTTDMRFRCELCNKYFHSKANLKVHYAVHTGERPHTCSFCGKGFSQKGNLTTHERIHKGERPYVCTTCGKGFTQKGNLTHHLAIHSKIKGRMRNSAEKWQ